MCLKITYAFYCYIFVVISYLSASLVFIFSWSYTFIGFYVVKELYEALLFVGVGLFCQLVNWSVCHTSINIEPCGDQGIQ